MTTYYKLTDANGCSRGGTQWGESVRHKARGKGSELCTDSVIHVYASPLAAALFSPIHVTGYTQLWKCEGPKSVAGDGLKIGVKWLRTLHQVPLPVLTLEQRVCCAIAWAKAVNSDPKWNKWADDWLSDKDRSAEAAAEAAEAARAAEGAAWAAAEAADIDLLAIAEAALGTQASIESA